MKRLASLVALTCLALLTLLAVSACGGVNADQRDKLRPCPDYDLRTACGRLDPATYYRL